MSQFGMQLPGGKLKRTGDWNNVYTGLLLVAVLALLAAIGFVSLAAQKVGPDGSMFAMQEQGRVKLANPEGGR